jgi:gamma-glutamylcyclotransferase
MAATTPTFVAFAYGSNMLTGRIRRRCPSAAVLGMAELHGHELQWHKRSRDGSGKCDVVQTNDGTAVVYGVLYEIPVAEKLALDMAEGLGNGYQAKNAEVAFKGAPRNASIYRAIDIDPSLKPYSWYKALVVAGAKEHALPGIYIERLMATDAIEDPDRERHNRNWQRLAADRCGPQS